MAKTSDLAFSASAEWNRAFFRNGAQPVDHGMASVSPDASVTKCPNCGATETTTRNGGVACAYCRTTFTQPATPAPRFIDVTGIDKAAAERLMLLADMSLFRGLDGEWKVAP